jgi:hypothetical protein
VPPWYSAADQLQEAEAVYTDGVLVRATPGTSWDL